MSTHAANLIAFALVAAVACGMPALARDGGPDRKATHRHVHRHGRQPTMPEAGAAEANLLAVPKPVPLAEAPPIPAQPTLDAPKQDTIPLPPAGVGQAGVPALPIMEPVAPPIDPPPPATIGTAAPAATSIPLAPAIVGGGVSALIVVFGLMRMRRRAKAVVAAVAGEIRADDAEIPALTFASPSLATPVIVAAPIPATSAWGPALDAMKWEPIAQDEASSSSVAPRDGAPTEEEEASFPPKLAQPAQAPSLYAARNVATAPIAAHWVPAGTAVVVAGTTIRGGMVYVGHDLPSLRAASNPDNCLIDPSLEVAKRGDGRAYLPYWPSYTGIDPNGRRAYLDWLAGTRDDPTADIGLAFIFFFGLERRLLLDDPGAERPALVAEVRRLLEIYGPGNHSFRTSAEALLDADTVRGPATGPEANFEMTAHVPWSLRLAMGRLAATGAPVPADLLLSLAMTHPETRVRTPARRCLPLLRELFVVELAAAHPAGLVVPRGRAKIGLTMRYRAASSTFEVDVAPPDAPLPDVLARDEPLGLARRLLESCTAQLDGYSRELGKAGGTAPTLAAASRLPPSIRLRAVEQGSAREMQQLRALSMGGQVELEAIQRAIGLPVAKGGKVGLAEAAGVLARLGLGLVPDPAFTLRAGRPGAGALLFPLADVVDARAEPTDAYRMAHLSLALGTMVAAADGLIDEAERQLLDATATGSPGLAVDEAARLRADRMWFEANPTILGDIRAAVAASDEPSRRRLLRDAAAIASADRTVSAHEVALLERLAKQLGLDTSTAYGLLHGNTEALSPERERPGRPAAGVDALRLAAIRAETLGTATILDGIFEDIEDNPDPSPPPPPAATGFGAGGPDGLDGRHASLLAELTARGSWLRAEFDRIARGCGLMPGSAMQVLNDWALDTFDELLLEGDDEVVVNMGLVPESERV